MDLPGKYIRDYRPENIYIHNKNLTEYRRFSMISGMIKILSDVRFVGNREDRGTDYRSNRGATRISSW